MAEREGFDLSTVCFNVLRITYPALPSPRISGRIGIHDFLRGKCQKKNRQDLRTKIEAVFT